MSYNKEEVKEHIELEDIYNILDYYNAEPQMFGDYITALTICHGGNSRKLYFYQNTHLFRCYSDSCGSFDIFELIQKMEGIEDLNRAVYFVVNFLNLQSYLEEVDLVETSEDWKMFNRYSKIKDISINKEKVVLPEIPNYIEHYPSLRIKPWEDEYIPKEIIDYIGIKYDPVNGNILIPHRDENGRLIGIRQRTLIQENEVYGKYRPAKVRGHLCNHPLSFNLFNLNIAKQNIKMAETAIVLESEKAALQAMNYLGIEGTIAVGMCGSSLSKYQFQLLLDSGAKEICIGLDRDFKEHGDDDFHSLIKKLEKLYQKYSTYANISFLFDKENLLEYHNSPTDCNKDVFLYLWRNRVVL